MKTEEGFPVNERFHVMGHDPGGFIAWVYDAETNSTRKWIKGFTYKEWTCWITGVKIPKNHTGNYHMKDGWAWRYSSPKLGGYVDGVPGYVPGEEKIRVAAMVFDPR